MRYLIIFLMIVSLYGCATRELSWTTKKYNADGTIDESIRRYRSNEINPDGIAKGVDLLGSGMQTIGDITGIPWLKLGGVGISSLAAGWFVRRQIHKAADRSYDEAAKVYSPPPQAIAAPINRL